MTILNAFALGSLHQSGQMLLVRHVASVLYSHKHDAQAMAAIVYMIEGQE